MPSSYKCIFNTYSPIAPERLLTYIRVFVAVYIYIEIVTDYSQRYNIIFIAMRDEFYDIYKYMHSTTTKTTTTTNEMINLTVSRSYVLAV
jgi:hypothetical protein